MSAAPSVIEIPHCPVAPLRFKTLAEFVQKPSITYLVRGIVPAEAIVLVFGPPKQGKTFTVCDLSMHAAHGLDWHGHSVRAPVRTAYLIGEGTAGFKVRLRAWIENHDTVETPGEFQIMDEALSLPANVEEVIEAAREFKPQQVVIDTLNAFYGVGDENGTQDMTVFVAAVRRLRDALKCAVIIIHHTGHHDHTRERGSIVLRGAADVIVQVAKDDGGSGNVGFQVVHARDMESWDEALALELISVDTEWLDEDGKPMRTCIVQAGEGRVTLAGRSSTLTKHEQRLVDILSELSTGLVPDAKGEVLLAQPDVSAAAKAGEMDRRRLSDAIAGLERKKMLRRTAPPGFWFKVRR